MFYSNEKLSGTIVFMSAFVLFTVISLSTHSSQAQIWKNMGKKIEQKVEDQASRRLERRIDKTIDKAFDGVEGAADDAVKSDKSNKKDKSSSSDTASPTEAKAPSGAQTPAFNFPISTAAVTLADSYEFNFGVTYEMQQTKGKKQEKVPGTTLWFGKDAYIGMASAMQKNMFMVMEGGTMITLMEDKKMYIAIGTGDAMESIAESAAAEAELENKDFSIKKIGSEAVLGYPCDVYEMSESGKDTKVKLWLTNALDVDGGNMMKAFSFMAKSAKSTMPGLNTQAPGGLMLKMESVDGKKNETVTMEATAVHKEGKKVDTQGYKSMGAF